LPVCPHAEGCALHASISMKEALRVWQTFYCEACFARCERFKLASAGRPVPPTLLPNGRLVEVGP
jgi:hypothetical protein